jgi:hypothetical protein
MTDTPKDLHLAIWELLTPEERPEGLYRYKGTRGYYWSDGWDGGIDDPLAHRAILDAAREVLDDALVEVFRTINIASSEWLFRHEDLAGEYESPVFYHSRTECIYHALKWLREAKQ